MFDMLVNGIDRSVRNFAEAFGSPVGTYCRLETVDHNTLVADDGSFITVLRLEGSLKHVGVDEYTNIIDILTEKLQSTFTKPGHLLQVVFEYDPQSSRARVSELLNPSKLTAQNLGMDLTALLNDWGEALVRNCSVEKTWLVLWTRISVLQENLRKTALKERQAAMCKAPNLPECQQVSRAVATLHDMHSGFVSGIVSAFKQVDLLVYELTPHEALHDIRFCIAPDFTGRDWQARIPGDLLPLRLPDSDVSEKDVLHQVIYPDFKTQLWPHEGHMTSSSTIRIGDRIFGPLIMTLMPQTPKPFQEYFRGLSQREERFPYRVSFLIEDGGLNQGLTPFLASIFSFTNSDNKKFNQAIAELRDLDLEGICCVKFKICFCTWTDIKNAASENEAHTLLRRHMAEFAKAIQGWGTADVSEGIGDPLLGFTATLPGMMPTSPAPATAAPLSDAIGMLPWRSASPWKEGSLLLRTQDGKIIPYAPSSSEQSAWIDLGVAPMGAGKSVFLNAMNFAFITQAGLSRLPWLSIIDVGASSSGLITLIKESLPHGQKHLAAYHRLRMTPEYAINPFDTPLGVRFPLPSHKVFLVNLLSLFATPLNATAPDDGVPGLLHRAIDSVYEKLSDEKEARPYQSNALPDLHAFILKENVANCDEKTTWWEIVDALFARGFIHEAIQAQRYAVPLLEEIAAETRQNDSFRNIYDEKTCMDVWRSLMDAINSYIILCKPTQFDIGDAQIISLDLDEIAPRGGAVADRQSGFAYMLARYILGQRFFFMPEDVKLISEKYQAYHKERVEAIREDPKRLCYDEAHRVTNNKSVAGQLQADMTTMARESRKWNLSIGLYTQSIDDIPPIIIELATTILILGAGTQQSIDEMAKRFGLNGACKAALSRLGKPSSKGANFVGLFRTGSGLSQLLLTLSIGGQSLWAFSSTTEDVAIRNRLYEFMSPTKALQILAVRFPGGSAKGEIERRRLRVTDQSFADDVLVNVIEEIVQELSGGTRI